MLPREAQALGGVRAGGGLSCTSWFLALDRWGHLASRPHPGRLGSAFWPGLFAKHLGLLSALGPGQLSALCSRWPTGASQQTAWPSPPLRLSVEALSWGFIVRPGSGLPAALLGSCCAALTRTWRSGLLSESFSHCVALSRLLFLSEPHFLGL